MKPNDNNPSLKQREDGSIHLIYSVKNDIAYQSYHERQRTIPIPSDFGMGGLKRSEWQKLLSCHNTIRAALTYNAETESSQRYYQLNNVRKDNLMYALRNLVEQDNHLYADRDYKGKVYGHPGGYCGTMDSTQPIYSFAF